jgi:hypothetical protein
MNQISWQIYGGSNKKANTFIGGVASVITTSGVLAAKLGIASNRITNFKIVGSDIECRIKGSYIIYYFAYNAPSVYSIITYYRDLDGLVTSISEQAFYNTVIREVYTPNATSIGLAAFDQNLPINPNKNELKILYIPRVTTIGNTVLNNIVFRSGNLGGGKIYVHPSLQTINAGGVEGDLAYLATGNIIRYVTNFTAPNFITDLSAGTIYGTAIQLNFTAPTGSTNAIEFYEVWVNGVFKSIIISGQYITGLIANTTYTIEVKPVDILYNKSTSNVIAVTTATTLVYQDSLVSYYKMENNVLDSWGTNNGTNTSVSYVAGKIGNAGSYNGTTSKTVIGNPANLQLSTGTVSCWIKTSAAGSSYRAIFSKENAYGLFLVDGVLGVFNWGSFGGSGLKSTGVNLNDNLWHNLVLVFESSTANNYIYVDGVLKLTFSMSVLNQSANLLIGLNSISQYINAVIDEISIYNTKLTQNEIDLIYNSGNGTTI